MNPRDILCLTGQAYQKFGQSVQVGQSLPHHQTRERGQFDCPPMVAEWRKPFEPDYFTNDLLVGCPVCKAVQWRFGHWRNAWTLRQYGYASVVPSCALELRDDLIMLTDGRYPDSLCPWTFSEESEVPIEQCGHARIYLTCTWGQAGDGYRVGLRSNGQYWMGTGLEERESIRDDASSCQRGDTALVGGLGLGIIVLELCQKHPSEITVYEIDQDVASLIWPKVQRWCEQRWPDVALHLCVDDVRHAEGRWDFVFMDIWDTANSPARPLLLEIREKAKAWVKDGGRIVCWQEERILGLDQVNSRGEVE